MNVLFVPSIGLDPTLLARLADSVDFPVKYKVAYNNGPPGALEAFQEAHRDWIIKEPIGNRGVAGSWNDCAKLFSEEPNWLLMNEDAWFLPGYLEKICACADGHPEAAMIYLNESQAYYCFVWTAQGLKDFGTFDENLWPAYYEDCDMRVRHRLKGGAQYAFALPGLTPLPHGKPRTGGINYTAMLQGTGLLLREYWARKWGAQNYENATFQHPYKDFRIPPHEWIWYPEQRAKLLPLWESFMAQNPSIYD